MMCVSTLRNSRFPEPVDLGAATLGVGDGEPSGGGSGSSSSNSSNNSGLSSSSPLTKLSGKGEKSKRKHPHIIVQHNYHDHSQEPPPPDTGLPGAPEGPGGQQQHHLSFPLKLYEMLERVEKDGNSHIVSWQPHGRCFVVHKPELFKELLPKYFKLSKIASFQRQLNLYGFMRLTRGMDKGGYYHELFLRGMTWLVSQIQRVKVKGTGVRARSNPDQEPDFWSMLPWVLDKSNGAKTPPGAPTTAATNGSGGNCSSSAAKTQPQQNQIQRASPQPLVSSCSSVISQESTCDSRSNSPTTAAPPQAPLAPKPKAMAKPAPPATTSTRTKPVMAFEADPLPAPLGGPSSTSYASAAAMQEDESDIVLRGWGKPFHYLDPFKPARPTVLNSHDASHQFVASIPGPPRLMPIHSMAQPVTHQRQHVPGPLVRPAVPVAPPVPRPSYLSGMDDVIETLDFDELVSDIFQDDGEVALADLLEKVID